MMNWASVSQTILLFCSSIVARWCSSSADTMPFDATLSACTSGPIVL